jgi:hypothetical protein
MIDEKRGKKNNTEDDRKYKLMINRRRILTGKQ